MAQAKLTARRRHVLTVFKLGGVRHASIHERPMMWWAIGDDDVTADVLWLRRKGYLDRAEYCAATDGKIDAGGVMLR